MTDRVQFTKALLLGLNAVPKHGVPGNVLCWSSQAFCFLETERGGCPAGAATFGQGRVAAFGHNGYIHGAHPSANTDNIKRMNRFVRNSVLWVTKNECEFYNSENIINELECGPYCENSDTSFINSYPFLPPPCRLPIKVGALGMNFKRLSEIVESISEGSSEKFTAVASEVITTVDTVEKVLSHPLDVILWVNSDCRGEVTPSASELDVRAEKLLHFVSQGGGVVVGVCPWGWDSLSGGSNLATRCVFNHFLEKVGMVLKSSYVDGDKGGMYDVATAIKRAEIRTSGPELVHKVVTDLLQRHGITKDELRHMLDYLGDIPDYVYTPTRMSRYNVQPLGVDQLSMDMTQLASLLSHFGAGGLKFPLSIKNGLGFDKAVQFLYLSWFQRYWQSLPPSHCPAAPLVEDFPGAVSPVAPRVSGFLYTINPQLKGWQTTGLYLPPGEVVQITLSDQALTAYPKLKLQVKVCSHTDTLKIIHESDDKYELQRYFRLFSERWWQPRTIGAPDMFPFSQRSAPATSSSMQIATPYGGLIYIEIFEGFDSSKRVPITFNIDGGVIAPYWNSQIESGSVPFNKYTDSYPYDTWPDVMTRAEQSAAPWGELEGRYVVITMTREAMTYVKNPTEIMEFWDAVISHELALSGQKLERKERLVFDRQISAGWLHSGYPVMGHLDGYSMSENGVPKIVDIDHMRNSAQWGIYHEFGHNRQRGEWTWSGCGEVTVNIFSLYCTHVLNGKSPYESDYFQKNCKKVVTDYLTSSKSYQDGWQRNCNIALGTYVLLIEAFGWKHLADVFRRYEKMPNNDKPKNDQDKITEWVKQTSLVSGYDLRSFYSQWRFPYNDQKLSELSSLPKYDINVLQTVESL